jgi:hypothetical protein
LTYVALLYKVLRSSARGACALRFVREETDVRVQDLVFLAAALGAVVAVIRVVALAAFGRVHEARRVVRRSLTVAAAYLAVVAAVGLLTPRRWLRVGEEQRFDDWALTVLRVDHVAGRYHVVVRVANHGRGRAQRAADADLRLVAADGRQFAPRAAPGTRSLRSVLQPGEAFDTGRDFDVPDDAVVVGLDVIHGGWPGRFIIGDRGSLFHKRPLVRIP